ncbi:dynein light chain roadblock, partial [Haematococcus lacustris]
MAASARPCHGRMGRLAKGHPGGQGHTEWPVVAIRDARVGFCSLPRQLTLRQAQSAGQSDVEATLSRIQSHKGVLGTVIVSSQGVPLRSTLDEALTKQYAELIPSLSDLARNLVRDLDPQ